MNNTFDIKRFGYVFRKDFLENGKRYLLSFLTLLGLITIVITYMTWLFYLNPYSGIKDYYISHNRELLTALSFMFLATGIWFASTFATSMNSRLKRLSYLVSPSSNLEKFLARWIITTVGFIVVFFAVMWTADILRVAICSVVYPEVDIKFLDITKLTCPDNSFSTLEFLMPKSGFLFFLSLYFLLQSLFLLGSTFWEKAAFVKTFTFVAVWIAVFLFISYQAILLFYGDFDKFSNVMYSLEATYPDEQFYPFVSIVVSVFTLTNWVLAFFRLKESEIIKRL
jgi:hypothetical protein